MKLRDTFMSSPICVKILKYQSVLKKFPFALQTIFSVHNLEENNFFHQLQLANNFFTKKVTPPDKK